MKNTKIKIIITITILFFTLLAFVLIKDNKKTDESGYVINILNDRNMFFSLNTIINDFYDEIASDEKEAYKLLDNEYINDNNILSTNIKEKLNISNDIYDYYSKKIKYIDDNDIIYYFINGYILKSDFSTDSVSYKDDINYLIIMKNNNYVIYPLDSNYNIDDLYKEDKVIINGGYYKKENVTDKALMTLYISYFDNMLIFDTEKAYNMLGENTLKKYSDITSFQKEKENIYNIMTSSVFTFSKEGKYYYVTNNDITYITFYEKNIMDFTIDFEKNNFN